MGRTLIILCMLSGLFLTSFAQENSTISNWKSGTKYGNVKEGRVLECSGQIKLGDLWKKDKPEVLIKTLDKNGLVMQVSQPVEIAENGSFKVSIGKIKDFNAYKLFIRNRNITEIFEQTFKARGDVPKLSENLLVQEEIKIEFNKKAEIITSKSGLDCVIVGQLVNHGGKQGTGVKVKAKLLDGLGKEIKTVDFSINDEKGVPIVFDGSDVYEFHESVKGAKGVYGAKFSISWDGDDVGKEIVVDNGQVGLEESSFEFDKVAGDASITKITSKFEGTDLNLKIEVYNDLKVSILNPVIELKLTNSKGEVIQPLKLEFEGELGAGLKFEFPYSHKNAPQFSGILQSIRYSTKK